MIEGGEFDEENMILSGIRYPGLQNKDFQFKMEATHKETGKKVYQTYRFFLPEVNDDSSYKTSSLSENFEINIIPHPAIVTPLKNGNSVITWSAKKHDESVYYVYTKIIDQYGEIVKDTF